MNVLDYQSPPPSPPRWRLLLANFRFVFLTAYVGVMAAAVIYSGEWGLLIPIAILTAAQGLFLIGMPEMRWPRATRKRSMMISQVVGALAATCLTAGLLGTVLSGFNQWDQFNRSLGIHIFWIIAAVWLLWTLVFALIWARQPFSGFTRIYKLLVAGTVLEVLITIPVDVHVRKRTSCWCDEGTFFAYVMATCVALWSFGPGLVLLFLTRRLQRDGYFSLCRKCGCDLSGIDEKRCPNCNTRIPRNNR